MNYLKELYTLQNLKFEEENITVETVIQKIELSSRRLEFTVSIKTSLFLFWPFRAGHLVEYPYALSLYKAKSDYEFVLQCAFFLRPKSWLSFKIPGIIFVLHVAVNTDYIEIVKTEIDNRRYSKKIIQIIFSTIVLFKVYPALQITDGKYVHCCFSFFEYSKSAEVRKQIKAAHYTFYLFSREHDIQQALSLYKIRKGIS